MAPNDEFIREVDEEYRRDQIAKIWQRYNGDPVWSGWRSLGGWAGYGVWLHDRRPTIRVTGEDYGYWCNQRGPPWSGWYKC